MRYQLNLRWQILHLSNSFKIQPSLALLPVSNLPLFLRESYSKFQQRKIELFNNWCVHEVQHKINLRAIRYWNIQIFGWQRRRQSKIKKNEIEGRIKKVEKKLLLNFLFQFHSILSIFLLALSCPNRFPFSVHRVHTVLLVHFKLPKYKNTKRARRNRIERKKWAKNKSLWKKRFRK